MKIDKKDFDQLKNVAASCGPKIEQSNIFLSLVSKSYLEDPTVALQLGIAILLGKPIAVIGIDGAQIPDGLRKMAFHVSQAKDVDEAKDQVRDALRTFHKLK